jgi:hypothetical protein
MPGICISLLGKVAKSITYVLLTEYAFIHHTKGFVRDNDYSNFVSLWVSDKHPHKKIHLQVNKNWNHGKESPSPGFSFSNFAMFLDMYSIVPGI